MTALTSVTEPSDAGYFARLDREAAKEEAQEDFIRQFASTLAKPWHFLNRIPEDRCDEIFDHALPAIYDDRKKATVFNQALLSVWVDPNSTMASRNISEMIEAEINQIAEKEFEKNPSLFSG